MLRADRTLIAPSVPELLEALHAVIELGNGQFAGPLHLTADLIARITAALDSQPEGDLCYNDAWPGSGGDYTALRVIWVSDYGLRRHVRLQTLRRRGDPGTGGSLTPLPNTEKSPAELVYADHVYDFQPAPEGASRLIVACGCGAVGGFDDIAWMGRQCGPCHDRVEAGEELLEPLNRHLRAPRSANSTNLVGRPLAALADGRHILLLRTTQVPPSRLAFRYEIVLWDLEEQRGERTWPLGQSNLGVNFSPDGSRLGILTPRGHGVELRVLDWPGGHELLQVEFPGTPRCFTLAPHGEEAFIGNLGQLFAVDLTQPDTPSRMFRFPEGAPFVDPLDLACSPDGRWLALFANNGTLTLYDRRTHQPGATALIPHATRRGVVVFTQDGENLLACDETGGIWFFEVPELRPLGRFRAERMIVNGLDVIGPWLMLMPLELDAMRCWPWEFLRDYARAYHRARTPADQASETPQQAG